MRIFRVLKLGTLADVGTDIDSETDPDLHCITIICIVSSE